VRPEEHRRRAVTIPTAGVSQVMAAYTIGFVKLEVYNSFEDAIGVGSAPSPSMTRMECH
jgi:hypothetical protein